MWLYDFMVNIRYMVIGIPARIFPAGAGCHYTNTAEVFQ